MKTKCIYLIMLTLVFLTANCKKEPTIEKVSTTNQIDLSEIRLFTYSSGLKSGTTMLAFNNINSFENTLKSLNQSMDSYQVAQTTESSSKTPNIVATAQPGPVYDEQQPLIDFENATGFVNSMRQAFNAAESEWLNHEELDMATYPKIIYPFTIEEMTLFNGAGEVKIGNAILSVSKDGYLWITDGSLNTLSSFKKNKKDIRVLTADNVITNLNESSSGAECSSWRAKDVPHPYTSGKKVIKHVHFHAYPWKATASAEITSYKKQLLGWFGYAIDLGVANQTYFKNSDCGPAQQVWSTWKRKNAKSIEQNNSIWGAYLGLRAKNNASVYGSFEYAGNTNSECLSW